jgi:tetratricopeptide (TPR) repeat protein
MLERNVSSLLETGGEAPRIADAARARIRAQLIANHSTPEVARARARTPLFAVLAGLAATAALALILLRVFGGHGGSDELALSDGSTYITAPDGKLTVLGPRHVRVEGAALLDVAPGQGTFTVETERGTIEVLGTRFLVDGEHDRTTAAVVRGQVRLASDAGNVVLHAGEQGIAEPGRLPVRGPAPRLSHLVSWAQDARRREEHTIEPLHHGSLFARDPGVRSHPPWGDEYPLPIKKLGVDIVVEDQVARVALDQTFRNDADQDLEGVYRFAIPSDAALQRLAMYVDGKLEESAVVERMRARRIYEELVYRRVDPALLEWAGTGRLSLRVYPLKARQDKRLMIAYTQSLPKLYDDYTLSVPLPEVDQPVGELAVAMRIKSCASCEISSTSHQIEVSRDGDDAVVRYRRSADKLGDSFVVHVRDPRHATTVATHADGDDHYLLVRAPSQVGGAPREYRPRTWVLLDDVSASRSALELRAQQDLIDAFLRELDEDDRVAIVAFDVDARQKLAPTRVRDVDRRAVRDALKTEGGVGATDFSIALAAAGKLLTGVAPEDAMVVYLGDGTITAGPRELDQLRAELAGKALFVGVGVGDSPDTQTLDALAAATAGYATTIDLADDLGWRAFDLVAALHTARVTGVEARLVDAQGALVPATVYLRSPQLTDGEQIEMVAKLAGSGTPAAVELTGTRDGTAWKQTVALAAAHDGGYLPRLWAERHIAARLLAKHEPVALTPCAGEPCPTEEQLREKRDEQIRQEVVALGKRYFLLSRHTSLLVLEDDEMYARYGVTKGAGDTWAPYHLPPTIPIVSLLAASAKPADAADDAVLVRAPLEAFYDQSAYQESWANKQQRVTVIDHLTAIDMPDTAGFAMLRGGGGGGRGGIETRAELGIAEGPAPTMPTSSTARPVDTTEKAGEDETKADVHARREIDADELRGAGKRGHFGGWAGRDVGGVGIGPLSLQRFGYLGDPAYDDLTGFVPALAADAADGWRKELARAGRAGDRHSIDDASRELLARARGELPTGIYRWGELEIAIDPAHRIGWRRTTLDGLGETASYDGKSWTRRYPELGLDVTREVRADDVALALAYLPIWIAEPDHFTRWFDVSAHGTEVTLAANGKPAYVLAFDDHARLVSVRDARGSLRVEVTWGSSGPTAARVSGEAVTVGFTPEAVTDAPAWAHGSAQPGVTVELPLRIPSYWAERVQHESTGTPAWQHAVEQWMASLAAAQDRGALFTTYEQLRAHGAVSLGDLALASGGIAAAPSAEAIAKAVAPFASQPLAGYLVASRAYAGSPRPDEVKVGSHDGFVGALWTMRGAVAQLQMLHGKSGMDAIAAIDARAPRLRLVAATFASARWELAGVDRAWDALAGTPYHNIALAQAAQVLASRGDYNGAADRIAKLAAEYDLHALPARYDQPVWVFQSSRRGAAGWSLVWASWRDRVLAGDSFAHVMALVPVAAQRPEDLPRVLARAAELAGSDPDRKVEVAQIALAYNQRAWAEHLLQPMAQSAPSHEVYQLLAQLHLADGDAGRAFADLEAAQAAGADEAVDISTVRAELGEIIAVARQLALESTGADRAHAIERAMYWANRWRAIDPGNTAIDSALGELLLAVGDGQGAWRQLSSTIERDPWSGTGYMTVAEAFEREGKVEAALPYWQQAIVIDQTNPTPRLRKAQALIALGRPGEGDALLGEIVHQHWHDMWSGVVYQAQDLLARGKAK